MAGVYAARRRRAAEDFLDGEIALVVTRRLQASVAEDVRAAAAMLRAGGTVAFPTETVYGLGANTLDAGAVRAIFAAKGRPAWDPLIVHVPEAAVVSQVARAEGEVAERVRLLAAAFWPGPLTMLLPRVAAVPDEVTAGRALVGVRVPGHAVARALLREAGVPVAAPSANRFSHTSPTTAAHVLDDLDGRIDAVLDGGACAVGVESTVVDVCASPMVVYRPGAVSLEQIRAVAGAVESYVPMGERAAPESLPSPGVGIRHYAPRARLVLVEGAAEMAVACAAAAGAVGVMLPAGWDAAGADAVYPWGVWGDAEELARRLFAGLRALVGAGVAVIVCPVPEGGGIAAAMRDRLGKAARVR